MKKDENFEWWKRRDGSRIRVRFMTHDHLKNTINMLRRYVRRIEEEIDWLTPSYYDDCKVNIIPVETFEARDLGKKWISVLRKELSRRVSPREEAPGYKPAKVARSIRPRGPEDTETFQGLTRGIAVRAVGSESSFMSRKRP